MSRFDDFRARPNLPKSHCLSGVRILNASTGKKMNNSAAGRIKPMSRNSRKQLLPALMALGACGMMAAPASALELGDLKINSSLGQPLRASIAYALNPYEELYDFCVYLRPGLAADGLPVLSMAKVSIADGTISLTGSRAIREPLLTMQLSIDCPYTAQLTREYTLMINPPTPVIREGPIVVEPPAAVEAKVATVTADAPKSRPAIESRRNRNLAPISQNSRYLVPRGDTVSEIAARISDRSIALWPAVDRIFAANPDAFMDGDVNRLKAGSWLEIPDLSGAVPQPVESETVTIVAESQSGNTADVSAYAGYEAPAATDIIDLEEPPVSEPDAAADDFSELQPGDVVVGIDSPFVSPIGSETDLTTTIDIPDTEILEPAIPPVPVVSTGQSDNVAGKTSGSWSWLMWLGGTGLALILGLLLFGQRVRQRFGSVAVGANADLSPSRRRTDARAQSAAVDVDFQIPEAKSQAYMTLDADFGDGSGLQDVSDMDVAQDFGYSASTTFEEQLDMLLPEGADAEDSSGTTDIIGPSQREQDPLVLDSEVLPGAYDDADYDLSMIVDVTKQDVVQSDVTEKDLQAVRVDSENKPGSEDYTLNKDVEYKILEQDYEEEFTATQALNSEIEKAAAELAERMDIDATGEMTARLPENTQAQNDDISLLDGTADNEEPTAELPGTDDDVTIEMPPDDNDLTVDMVIESGMIDTKKKKKAS
jgi:hypothetical protein